MEHITYEEFYDEIWGNISANLVSEDYLSLNTEFIDHVTFDMYRFWSMDSNLSIIAVRKLIESMLFSMFRFKPDLNNIC